MHGHAESASTGRMSINALDSRDAELIQVVPDTRRADDREKAALFIRWIVGHQRIGEDGIIAIVYRGHFNQGATRFGSPIVAGKLTERPFALDRIRFDDAFDHEFRIGRQK